MFRQHDEDTNFNSDVVEPSEFLDDPATDDDSIISHNIILAGNKSEFVQTAMLFNGGDKETTLSFNPTRKSSLSRDENKLNMYYKNLVETNLHDNILPITTNRIDIYCFNIVDNLLYSNIRPTLEQNTESVHTNRLGYNKKIMDDIIFQRGNLRRYSVRYWKFSTNHSSIP